MTTAETLIGAQMRGVGAEADVSCGWDLDPEGFYETDCGHAFRFDDGGPKDNDFTFCPYCGRSLRS